MKGRSTCLKSELHNLDQQSTTELLALESHLQDYCFEYQQVLASFKLTRCLSLEFDYRAARKILWTCYLMLGKFEPNFTPLLVEKLTQVCRDVRSESGKRKSGQTQYKHYADPG